MSLRMVVVVLVSVVLVGCPFAPSGDSPDAEPPALPVPDAAVLPDAQVAPAGYASMEGSSSYYRWSEERAELAEALEDCADDGLRTSLVVIDDAAENQALQQVAATLPMGRQIWLSIQDWHDEGEWRTLALEPVVFSAWLDGEPNDAGRGEDCAVLLARFDPERHEGRWNDVDCTLSRAYACEWRPGVE